MLIGAHVPMDDGLMGALDYADLTGCEAIQVFSKSPRRWSAPQRDPATTTEFRAACAARGGLPVFTHASYLINLGASDPVQWERSCAALADELERAYQLGATGMVVHLGTRFCDDRGDCTGRVAETARRAVDLAKGPVATLLLENSAGAGRQYGTDAPEMTAALNAVRDAGVVAGLCLDTCHAFAAGIDLRDEAGWTGLLSEIERSCGRDAVALVHANDCKGELHSHKDRHDWIGDGTIGEAGFAAMLAQPFLDGACAVVEMPGEPPLKDAENVSRLKRLRGDGGESAGRGPALV